MKKIILFCIALLLSGCATTQLAEADGKRIRNVAIINLVPEKANFAKVGLTVFNNEKGEIDMNGKINETIQSAVNHRISQVRPDWNIKTVDYDRTALAEKLYSAGLFMTSRTEKIEEDLINLARNNGLDAVIVIHSFKNDILAGDGVGVLMRSMTLSSIRHAFVHSHVSVSIIDPEGKVAAAGTGRPSEITAKQVFNPGARLTAGVKQIDPRGYGLKYELKDNYRPDLLDRLKSDITEHLAKSIRLSFEKIGL